MENSNNYAVNGVIKMYSSHGVSMDWHEFKIIEVDERQNYPLDEVNEWETKYSLEDDTVVIWVSPSPTMANSYNFDSSDRDYALSDEFDMNELSVIDMTKEIKTIITESDDGDDGFLAILN